MITYNVLRNQSVFASYVSQANPSGFITGVDLSPYATLSALNATGAGLVALLGGYDVSGSASAVSGALQTEINALPTVASLSGSGYYFSGTFYGDGSRLTGIAGGGGGGGSNSGNYTGSFTVNSLQLFESGNFVTSTGWNPLFQPWAFINVGGISLALPTVSGAASNGVTAWVRNNASTVATITTSPANIIAPGKATSSTSFVLQAASTYQIGCFGGSWIVMGGLPYSVADAQITAQNSTGNILSFANPGSAGVNNMYHVSAYLNLTALSTDILHTQVSWTDIAGTARTQNFYPMGATGVSGANISTTGFYAYPPVTIIAKQGSAITVATVATTIGGSMTFDAGANITRLD
jgi:hypothetical protein